MLGVASWVHSFFGKLLAGPKKPLIEVATLLRLPEEGLERMRSSSAEDCEMVLLRHLDHGHGGIVDWRARLDDVVEATAPALTTEEREVLMSYSGKDGDNPGFPAAIHLLDARLRAPMRALRAIPSPG
jgi:hypothetical protein